MAEEAHVSSVAALEAFRARLIVYLSKARPALEEVASEVMRTKLWVQNDQRNHWEKQVKLRHRELERAQEELLSARMSKLENATAAQEMALHRIQRALGEADDKLRVLKRWERELDNRSEPLLKLVEQLHGFLTTELAHAQVVLGEMIKALQSYAESAPAATRPSVPVAAVDSPQEQGAASDSGKDAGSAQQR